MNGSKKTSPPAAQPGRADSPGTSSAVQLPRTWLIALVAVFLAPWAIAAWIYLDDPDPVVSTPVSNGPSVKSSHGPWGELLESPIVISPPLEYVPATAGRNGEPVWFFPDVSTELLDAFWVTAGLGQSDIAHLRGRTSAAAQIRGQVVTPGREWIRSMPATVRTRLYPELAKSRLNQDQEQSFRFLGASPGEWLDGSPISAETRALVEPLIYKVGDFLYFADLEAVRPLITDPAEMQRLLKTLLRHSTVLVRLTVPREADIDALAEYWGRGGRRTDVRPLLESVAGGDADRSIDIVHLLPAFARNTLYRYPRITAADLNRPVIANCLWSSLNFFRDDPDDRYLEPEVAIDALRTQYYIVEHGYQLGDIVAFLDDEGDLLHVAVYVAEDMAFTKNGTSPNAPWTLMSIPHIKDYYRAHADDMRLIYHRRKDF
jgi:hypothetical protein